MMIERRRRCVRTRVDFSQGETLRALFLFSRHAERRQSLNGFSFGQRNHDRTRVSPTCKGASGLHHGDRKPREGESRDSIEARFRSLFL